MAIGQACAKALSADPRGSIERLEERRMLSVVFTDDYSADTSANYIHTQQTAPPGFVDSWAVSGGTLNYTVPTTTAGNWNTSVFLTKPTVASTAGLLLTRTSGDLTGPKDFQAGLVLSGDPTNGGFVVAEYDNGIYNNHLVLLRETGGQLTGDEGGVGNPPVLADFGDISSFNTDTFHVVGTIDRTGAHPVITVAITDTTNPSNTIASQTITDANDAANFGGNTIGWRARYHDLVGADGNPVHFSVDNLQLENLIPPATQAPVAPTNLTATPASAGVTLSWTDPNAGTFQYTLERSLDGTNWATIATPPGVAQNATATYTDQLLSPPGATFLYRVRATNGFQGGSVSGPSNVATFTVGPRTGSAFIDNYDTDTTGNYVEQSSSPTGLSDFWLIFSSSLNFSVSANNGWNSDTFLLKPGVANTAGLYKFTTSGDIIAPSGIQGGLVLSGDTVNGGFVVQEDAGSHDFKLLRLTGAQMLGDEGGSGNPPVLADFGNIAGHESDTFHVSGTVDRTGAHPVISVTITDTTDPTFVLAPKTATDTNDPAYFGGVQIGWRVRENGSIGVAFDSLSLQPVALASADHAPAAPTSLTGSESAGTVTLHWINNADNATDVIIQRSTNGVGFTSIGDVAPGAPGSQGTFTDAPVAIAGTVYYYRALTFNGFQGGTQSAPSNVVQVTISTSSGATATYYNQGFWGGAPVDRQTVTTIDYSDAANGQASNPTKVTNNSENGIIYTGKLKITTPGIYTFISNTSEDGYLYVDGVLVSSDPGLHAQRDATNLVPLNLTAGNHDFVFMQTWARYVGFDGSEGAHFEWVTPGSTGPTLVPALAMDPVSDTPAVPGAPTVGTTSANSIDVSFTANNNAVVHYLVQRSGDGGTTWSTISQLDPASNAQTGGTPGTSVTLHASDAAPVQGASYQYRAIAVGTDGSSAPSAASAATAVPAYTVSPTTPGVEAHYFNGELWKTGSATNLGSPDEFGLTTASANNNGGIDYGLGGNQSPDLTAFPDLPRIHPISFSAAYTGRILTDGAGVYTFSSNTDDDGYFYVNGVLVSSDPGGHGPQEPPAANIHPVTLAANTAYDFVFLFNQDAGGSAIHAEWIEPGSTTRVPVPISNGTTGGFLQASDAPFMQTVDPTTGIVTKDTTASGAGNVTGTTPATGSGAVINWTDQSTSEIWWEIDRSSSATGTYTPVGTAGLNATSFTDTTAASGTTYFYKVRGVNYDAVGPFSAPISVVAGGGVVSQTINGTAANDTITIKKDADGTHDDIWINAPITGPATQQALIGQTIVINGLGVASGGTDTLVFDSSAGNPVPTGTGVVLRLNGGTGTFTLGGTAPILDATHLVDLGTSTLILPYAGTSILPAVQAYLKNAIIKSTDAAGSSGKFAIADTDSGSQVKLSYRVVGDINGDGTVGFADLLTLAQNYNGTGKDWSKGDLNYDGTVGFADLLSLAQHYNQTAAAAPAVAAASQPLAAQTLDSTLLKSKKKH